YGRVRWGVGKGEVGGFMVWGGAGGRALVDRELYLPEEWILDRDRARRAGVAEDVAFASKPDLAVRMIERAVNAHGNVAWVVANGAIGTSARLRQWLEERPLGYVLPTRGDEPVVTGDGSAGEAGGLSALLSESAWTRLPAGPTTVPGANDWARIMLGGVELDHEGDRWESSLLISRSSVNRPGHLDFYRCYAPAATPLTELV